MSNIIKQFVIYDHPKDFPSDFVVREFHITKGKILPMDEVAFRCSEAEPLRKTLAQMGLEKVPVDEPNPIILEVWM